jgi:hypothetical protein
VQTYLGRVMRDIDRKLPQQQRTTVWQQALRLAWRINRQQRGDANEQDCWGLWTKVLPVIR